MTVTAQDEWNNTVKTFVQQVTLTQTGGTAGADGPPKAGVHINNTAVNTDDNYTYQAGDQGVHNFPVTAYTAETITRFTATGGGQTGDSGQVVVNAGVLHHFNVEATTPQTAGAAFNVTVTAQDEWNNTVKTFTQQVTLTHNGTAGADGPPKVGVHINNTAVNTDDNYTFVAGDQGVHAFPVTAYTAEQITFTATGGGQTGDSGQVVVNAGVLHHFNVEATTPQTAGAAFNVTVTAQDEWNNTVKTFVQQVTLTQTGGTAYNADPPPQGVLLPAAYTYQAGDQGVHAFPVTAYTAETITRFTATGGGETGDSDPVVVEAP